MPKAIDLLGRKFGRTKVIGLSHRDYCKHWLLKCDCGEVFIRRQHDIIKGLVYECPNCVFRRSEFYIAGKKFCRLSIQDKWEMREDSNGHKYRVWWCHCECGTKLWVRADSIRKGSTVSCGCFATKNNSKWCNETLYPRNRHYRSNDQEYRIWISIIHKCYKPSHQSYDWFGALGYTVCPIWRNDFLTFGDWLHERGWNKSLQVHLPEGKKIFDASNCVLIDQKEFFRIVRYKVALKKYGIDYNGERKLMSEWAKVFGINAGTFGSRMRACNFDIEKCKMKDRWGGSGSKLKRTDVSDKKLLYLYNQGLTIEEIGTLTHFSGVWARLHNMEGFTPRPRHRRNLSEERE